MHYVADVEVEDPLVLIEEAEHSSHINLFVLFTFVQCVGAAIFAFFTLVFGVVNININFFDVIVFLEITQSKTNVFIILFLFDVTSQFLFFFLVHG